MLLIIVGVHLLLNGTRYANNSEILIFEIGQVNSEAESDVNEALQCVTNKMPCCRSDRIGQWYFPNGMLVSVKGRSQFFYRDRGDNGTVNLNRVSENVMSPTGQFCCVVPDSNGTNQTLCVNIVLELTSSKSWNNSCLPTHAITLPYIITATATLLSTLHGGNQSSEFESGNLLYIIGGSIAAAVAVSIIITIPATVIIFVLVLRYCRKKR
jgi:hypothetical protein